MYAITLSRPCSEGCQSECNGFTLLHGQQSQIQQIGVLRVFQSLVQNIVLSQFSYMFPQRLKNYIG